jgi:hypothetical protein
MLLAKSGGSDRTAYLARIGPGPLRRPAMSLKPSPIQPVPEATARVAKAAFGKGNPLLRLRDGTVNLSAEDRQGWAVASPTRQPRHR